MVVYMKFYKEKYCSVVFLLIAIILVSGCTSDTEYTPPSKVESTLSDVTQKETPKTQIFNIGDTTTDNQLKITLNDVTFVSKIDEQNNQYLVAEAQSGKQYAVVDITIENILSNQTQTISTMLSTSILDQDGYEYKIDFEGLIALDKSFKDGEILPGMKKRGRIAYIIPNDTTDLKFVFKFDVLSGTTAVFDIK